MPLVHITTYSVVLTWRWWITSSLHNLHHPSHLAITGWSNYKYRIPYNIVSKPSHSTEYCPLLLLDCSYIYSLGEAIMYALWPLPLPKYKTQCQRDSGDNRTVNRVYRELSLHKGIDRGNRGQCSTDPILLFYVREELPSPWFVISLKW
jgi:hypothetical protein